MNRLVHSVSCVVLVLVAGQTLAQSRPASESTTGVEIDKIIASVAKKTGKKFVVDPRVRAQVNIEGVSIENIGYPELLTVLAVHGFAAVNEGNLVEVVPEVNVRQLPIPTVTGNKQYADGEFVTRILTPKSLPATQLIPMLRPLLPQYSHLAAIGCTNTMIIIDRYANVQRVVGIIESMDKGEPYKAPPCNVLDVKKE